MRRTILLDIPEYLQARNLTSMKSVNEDSMSKAIYIHTGAKPYQCEIYKRRFNVNGNLSAHMVIHLYEGQTFV